MPDDAARCPHLDLHYPSISVFGRKAEIAEHLLCAAHGAFLGQRGLEAEAWAKISVDQVILWVLEPVYGVGQVVEDRGKMRAWAGPRRGWIWRHCSRWTGNAKADGV